MRSDHVRKGRLQPLEEPITDPADGDGRHGAQPEQHRLGRHAGGERAPKSVEQAGGRVERHVQHLPPGRNGGQGIDHGAREHPQLDGEGQYVAYVTVVHVERAQRDAHAGGEKRTQDEERHDENGRRPQSGPEERCEREVEPDADPELDGRRHHRGEEWRLARAADLPDEPAVRQPRAGARPRRGLQEQPRAQRGVGKRGGEPARRGAGPARSSTRRPRAASGARVAPSKLVRSIMMPTKNQKGSMIRTMMKVFEPSAWNMSPTVPAMNPRARPRSSAWAALSKASRLRLRIDQTSQPNAANPRMPVSMSVRGYWASR